MAAGAELLLDRVGGGGELLLDRMGAGGELFVEWYKIWYHSKKNSRR
jgi:hypothetical protein